MEQPLSPAPLERRIGAGVVDALLLSGLSAAYFLVPLLTSGLAVPMWGVLAAGIGYAIVPLIAKGFAARAGGDATSGAPVQVYSAGAWTNARLVTLPEVRFGQAKAEQVLAAVIDRLPTGLDAVMGVNLAWRFRVLNDGTKLTFEPQVPIGEQASP